MGIPQDFGDVASLCINPEKSSTAPICREEINLEDFLQSFMGSIATFPVKYLGLPVTTSRLCLVHLQFIIDIVRARLAGWKGKSMSIVGRRVLVRCMLSAIPSFNSPYYGHRRSCSRKSTKVDNVFSGSKARRSLVEAARSTD